METAIKTVVRSYISLTKPGIVMANAISAVSGYLLVMKGEVHLQAFFCLLFGLSCIIASACTFNNCFDIELDQTMDRTKNRPLVTGVIEKKQAFFFASALAFIGGGFLYPLGSFSIALAFFGLFFYVAIYTFMKYVSPYATLVGSIPGAVPPLVGYAAATDSISVDFDYRLFFLVFLLFVFWQMPHFYAISLFRIEEFQKARLPVFPLKKGVEKTKWHMLGFCILFTATVGMLTPYFRGKIGYLALTGGLSLYWLFQCLTGLWKKDSQTWARSVFFTSILLVMAFALSTLFFT